ncbi:MAG: hypothetical protein LBH61_05960 [Dysgonamonadaceae bacterium]|jgi:predicted membrane protein|nr:hypothetical protein [Dysgonamonadaceae bacterium]
MKKIIIGIIIVMLGVYLLFNNLGYLPAAVHRLVISWQMLLIAIGTVFLFDRKSGHRNQRAGMILIFIGAAFLLPKIFNAELSRILVPLLIIFAGIYFVVIAFRKKEPDCIAFKRKYLRHLNNVPFEETIINEDGTVKRSYVFTGSKEKWNHGKIKRVEIEAVFSGIELDFSQVELSEEVEAIHIKVESVFSGIALYIPEEWNTVIQKAGIFGDFVDNRPRSVIQQAAKGKTVVLELESVFGGGEIRCYE